MDTVTVTREELLKVAAEMGVVFEDEGEIEIYVDLANSLEEEKLDKIEKPVSTDSL